MSQRRCREMRRTSYPSLGEELSSGACPLALNALCQCVREISELLGGNEIQVTVTCDRN